MNPAEPDVSGRGSLVGFLFFFALGLIFTIMGVTALLAGLATDTGGSGQAGSLVAAVVGGVFAFVGIGICLFAFRFRSTSRHTQSMRSTHPEEPWRWRADWAEGRIKSSMGPQAVLLWFFALVWNAISWTITPLAFADFGPGDRGALFVLLFPLVGLFLIGLATMMTLRANRFGQSTLTLETIPAVIGGDCLGKIVCSKPFVPDDLLQLSLTCVRIVRSGSGKNSTTHHTTIWETRKRLTAAELAQDGRETIIPVSFEIPYGLPSSNEENPRNRLVWKLHAKADMTGADYDHSFVIPAFTTPESSPDVIERPIEEVDIDAADQRGSVLENSPIGFTKLDDGAVEISFPAGRNLGASLSLGIFALIWGAITVGLAMSDAPLIFPIVFGFFEVLMLSIVLHFILGASLVHVRPDGLGYEKRVFGFIRRGWHPKSEIKDLTIDVSMQSGEKCWYRLNLILTNKRRVTLGSGIPSREEALALMSVAEELLEIGPGRSPGQPQDDEAV